jgi:phosphoribosylformimino-5-aminoimidazole carboxamide ribotide isomerase
MSLTLYPAIDLRGGRCVRLAKGDYDAETVYDDDPVAVARGFAAAGASWIHVVDLDAARTGVRANASVVRAITAAVAADGVSVQAGGGVRSLDAATDLWDSGVARVVVGTAAVEDPSLVSALAARGSVAVGLDARDGEIAVHGWRSGSGQRISSLLAALPANGVSAVIVTDIGRDGMLAGPDVPGLTAVLTEAPLGVDVIASGGVRSAADLSALAALVAGGRRLSGVIVGKAIYEGRMTVEEGVAACAQSA